MSARSTPARMDIPGFQPDRDRWEKDLHREVRLAVEQYRRASDEHHQLLRASLSRDWMGGPDGHQALYAAAHAERYALQKYMEALRALTKAVVPLKPESDVSRETSGVAGKDLTTREVEVLKLIASGLSSREISAQLDISFKTVVVHRYNIMRKLEVHDVVSLVRYAVRKKLVKL